MNTKALFIIALLCAFAQGTWAQKPAVYVVEMQHQPIMTPATGDQLARENRRFQKCDENPSE